MDSVKLILASASPRRRTLLKQIGLTFQTFASHVEEPPFNGDNPAEYAVELAHSKAREVSHKFPEALVLGADTIVVIKNQVLGKPMDHDAALRMLQLLSGNYHEVITAYSLQHKDKGIQEDHFVSTRVHFKQLRDDEIEKYIATGSPFDKAGSYGIQDYSSIFVDHIEGCFYNVVGLPLADFNSKLINLLSRHNFSLQ